MKARLALALTLVTLLTLIVPWGQAFAAGPYLEIEVTNDYFVVFDGEPAPVEVTLTSVGDQEALDVVVSSSTYEHVAVGGMPLGNLTNVTLLLEDYDIGPNEVEIYASYSGRETERRKVHFEVRPPEESIALRVVDAPASIYDGTVYAPTLEVRNRWSRPVSGARIKSGDEVLYNVDTLSANTAQEISLRVENYKAGMNRIELVAESERGTAPPVPLEFEVIPADQAVKVYLSKSTSPTYRMETLQFNIVVAASEDAAVTDLEVKTLTEGVKPRGYFLGEQGTQAQPEEEINTSTLQSLLVPTQQQQQQQEEAPETVIKGDELYFEASELPAGALPLRFQISYRLGKATVQREFTVDTRVLEIPRMQLIQAEQTKATEGEDVVVSLHVANGLRIAVDSVSVLPVSDIPMSPADFFIGPMGPGDFLPAYFTISSDDVEDGDTLSFKLVYRIGTDDYDTAPLRTVVHIEEKERRNPAFIAIPIVVVVLLVIIFLLLRRRK